MEISLIDGDSVAARPVVAVVVVAAGARLAGRGAVLEVDVVVGELDVAARAAG